MNWINLQNFFADKPKFRYNQARDFVFKNLITDWQEASSLPKDWQDELNEICPLNLQYDILNSTDGETSKAVLTLSDGQKIETVLMRYEKGRSTICLSSQIGCAVKCSFCATGQMGFKRDLQPFEMLEQVLLFARILKSENRQLTNLVFMGMGEPFLNFENVIESTNLIKSKEYFNLGNRHISISTVGLPEEIKKFADLETEINLAVSLHSADEEKRKQLIPLAQNFSVEQILQAVDYYIAKTNRKVMFEYLMLDGFNDTVEDAVLLTKLMKKKLYHVNLVRYNKTDCAYKCSSVETIKAFKKFLMERGVNVTERYSFGSEIKAACGQLAQNG
ncbi:MAG: 23S rRNA (adenine(2503)-C(2))-methyltransferase RlmN [Patescibacteria group bacterium]